MASEPTDEMVEAAARAIHRRRNRGMKNVWSWDDSGLEDEYPGYRDTVIADARAALTAALAVLERTPVVVPREPTEAMLEWCCDCDTSICKDPREAYLAMLAAFQAPDTNG